MYEVSPHLKDELPLLARHGTLDSSFIQANGNNNALEGVDPVVFTKQVCIELVRK